MEKDTVAEVEAPRFVYLQIKKKKIISRGLSVSSTLSSDESSAEKGHVEQVNLHNNISAK